MRQEIVILVVVVVLTVAVGVVGHTLSQREDRQPEQRRVELPETNLCTGEPIDPDARPGDPDWDDMMDCLDALEEWPEGELAP